MLIDFKHLDLELEHKSEINGCINTKNFVMAADLDQYAIFNRAFVNANYQRINCIKM